MLLINDDGPLLYVNSYVYLNGDEYALDFKVDDLDYGPSEDLLGAHLGAEFVSHDYVEEWRTLTIDIAVWTVCYHGKVAEFSWTFNKNNNSFSGVFVREY